MALATDAAGIQFRTLNASKGPAVRATRAQADRTLYRKAIRGMLEAQENLAIFQQSVVDIDIRKGRARGVLTAMGLAFSAPAVVLTTGTFLGGRIHIGLESHAGGRAGDPASNALAERLRALPFAVDRLKTGTPPRIAGDTVDFTRMQPQWGDEPCPTMSFVSDGSEHPRQVACHIAATNARTHRIIRGGLDRSPMYAGEIEGAGPRYCPSIEDKVVRFADRNSHQIFVEPEGLDTDELYPNGISTSLPFEVQFALVRSIEGFEQARITRPGYAIEYDFFDPRGLEPSLQTKAVSGLYFAGQINGTTGYEEAAAQGLLAGLNAARKVAGGEPWTPQRHEAYLGVLVDDLVTLGTNEPYRMFSSRAEYRLRLRQDNADLRLTPVARKLGLIDAARWRGFEAKRDAIKKASAALKATSVAPGSELGARLEARCGEAVAKDTNLFDYLKRPAVTAADLRAVDAVDAGDSRAGARAGGNPSEVRWLYQTPGPGNRQGQGAGECRFAPRPRLRDHRRAVQRVEGKALAGKADDAGAGVPHPRDHAGGAVPCCSFMRSGWPAGSNKNPNPSGSARRVEPRESGRARSNASRCVQRTRPALEPRL